MFSEGEIIYFDPFYFKNGNTAKEKYCLILKVIGTLSIIASLPTRKDSIPAHHEERTGCIELPEARLNCFVIPANSVVTTNGKSFPFRTHLHGHELDSYEQTLLRELYVIENTDYMRWGQMLPEILADILTCFRNSGSVKRGIKRLL